MENEALNYLTKRLVEAENKLELYKYSCHWWQRAAEKEIIKLGKGELEKIYIIAGKEGVIF